MKTPHLSIIATVSISTAAILIFALAVTTIPSNVHRSAPAQITATSNIENVVQNVSNEPPCVTHIENQTIDAGSLGWFSCPVEDFFTSTKILKINGFYGVYHNSTDDRADTYVLEPGHSGTITYLILGHATHYIGERPAGWNPKTQTQIANDVIYMHHQIMTIPQTVKQMYQFGPNGTKIPFFEACHQTSFDETAGGEECVSGPGLAPPDHITIDAFRSSHPGIKVSYQPQSETVLDNGTAIVTATISAESDVPTGTYWVILSPGQCNGGPILLIAITKCSD